MNLRLLGLGVVLALVTGCSSVCDRDKMPGKGDASSPESAVALVQYCCRNECWSTLYDLASAKTKDKYSYLEFRVAFPRLDAPGREEKVAALIARTTDVLVSRSHLGDNFRLAYLTLKEGRESHDFNVLLIEETDGDGKTEFHVALQEQVERKVAFE